MNDTMGFHLYDKWITNLRAGNKIDIFFEDNLYTTIAVYGYGMIGKQVLAELKDTKINVACVIDKKAGDFDHSSYRIVYPEDIIEYKDVQAIVVTPFDYCAEIEKDLKERINNCSTDIISVLSVVEYVNMYGKKYE